MIATVGRKQWKAQSFEQVSLAYLGAIAASGMTYPPRCEILNYEGKIIAHVTRDGVVYPGAVMRLDAPPLYVPPRS